MCIYAYMCAYTYKERGQWQYGVTSQRCPRLSFGTQSHHEALSDQSWP